MAEYLSDAAPDILAINHIDDGDALMLATQFNRQWAYRGGQAIFWNARFSPARVHESYLPAPRLPAFERRGLLRVDGRCTDRETALLATRFAPDRGRARDLRLTRTVIRETRTQRMLLFIANPMVGVSAFSDLGFSAGNACATPALMLATRGCTLQSCLARAYVPGRGAELIARIKV